MSWRRAWAASASVSMRPARGRPRFALVEQHGAAAAHQGLKEVAHAGQALAQLPQLATRLGDVLVEALGLLVVQVARMGVGDAPLDAEHKRGGLKAPQPGAVVDGPVAALGHAQQVRVVRRRQRADEVQ